MNTPELSNPKKLRLDPFLFPWDTDFRFVLLTIAIISTSLFVFNWLFSSFNSTYFQEMILGCADTTGIVQNSGGTPQDQINQDATAARAAQVCLEPLEQRQATWALGGIAILLVVTGVVYWLTPLVLIRRQHLQLLAGEDAPEVLAYVEEQCAAMCLAEKPEVYWNPANLSISGQAFGRIGRRCLALTGGLVVQFHTDPPAAQAVVLHELSHFKNRDVDKTYLATSAWYAFVLCALIPFGITMIGYVQRAAFLIVFEFGWRLGALAVFVFLMRNAILRAREPYADVRASIYAGRTDALQRVLDAASQENAGTIKNLFSTHPTAQFRRTVLDNTLPLFSLGMGDALAAGMAASLASVSSIYRITELMPPNLEWLANWMYWLVFAPFAVGVLALSLWRAGFASVVANHAMPKFVGRYGSIFGLGIIVGLILEPQTAIFGFGTFTGGTYNMFFVLLQLVWCVTVVLSCCFIATWIRDSAHAWLSARAWTRPVTRLIIWVGVFIAVVWMLAWLSTLMTIASDGGMSMLYCLSVQ